MNHLSLNTSCITHLAQKPSERVQNFLKGTIASKNQLSEYTSLKTFEDKVSVDRIPQVIDELRSYEEFCVDKDNFEEAEKCVKKVEQLQKQEVKFTSKTTKKINKSEMSELEEMNLQQFQEFNAIWDQTIEEHQKDLKQKEVDFVAFQEQQMEEFDEQSKQIVFPKAKYCPEVLQLRRLLDKLRLSKRYVEMLDVKKRILELEVRDEQKWHEMHVQKVAGQRVQLLQKQKIELQALQIKLENQLQLKIRTRKQEMEKYAQWLSNMKQELKVQQGLELSRIISSGEKRNSRVTGGMCNSSILQNPNYSQLLDISKTFNHSSSQN